MNCPSPDVGHWAAPNFILSAQWLGVVVAGMQSDLTFVYNEATKWENAEQAGMFATQAAVLQPAVMAPFGSIVHPRVEVLQQQEEEAAGHGVLARSTSTSASASASTSASAFASAHTTGTPGTIRARAWAMPPSAINASDPMACGAYIVAVNTDEERSVLGVSLKVRMSGAAANAVTAVDGTEDGRGGAPPAARVSFPTNATRVFEAAYVVGVDALGVLTDDFGPGRTNVYCVQASR